MKLNKDGMWELRGEIEKQLANVPDGQRIHLDKELLESLLFETIVYNNKTKEKLKLPVWSGEFLQKIDLSEVSFEDVAWSLLVKDEYYSERYDLDSYSFFMSQTSFNELVEKVEYYRLEEDEMINYSMTNAKIDFAKSFEFKKFGVVHIRFCNFADIDLSNNDMSKITDVHCCNLSNTKLVITSAILDSLEIYSGIIYNTDLSNLDLSEITVDAFDLVCNKTNFGCGCNFTNTGLRVLNFESKELIDEISKWPKFECEDFMSRLVGCYINDKKIHSLEEKETIAQTKWEEYEIYKQKTIDSITKSIEEQINEIKRKSLQ